MKASQQLECSKSTTELLDGHNGYALKYDIPSNVTE